MLLGPEQRTVWDPVLFRAGRFWRICTYVFGGMFWANMFAGQLGGLREFLMRYFFLLGIKTF